MKKFFANLFNTKNSKKTLGIIIGTIVVIAIVVVGSLFATDVIGDKNKKLQKKLETKLEELGRDFYESYYYDEHGKDDQSKKEFAKKYANQGVIINLDNIVKTNYSKKQDVLNEFKNSSGQACDYKKTKVAIYPKEPYGVKDYDIKVTLEC